MLPTYVIEAPRYLPVEKQVNTSLAEFRQQARTTPAIVVELPALKALVQHDSALVLKAQDAKPVRLAKL